MEADNPTINVPDDVHLTYDGIHEYIKHDNQIVTPPPSVLTPIDEDLECECNEPNPECKNCQREVFNYNIYLERINHNTQIKLKEITEAYNTLRAILPEKLHTNYVSGLNTGIMLGTVATSTFAVIAVSILKHFKRI